jgi:hypothetical protein
MGTRTAVSAIWIAARFFVIGGPDAGPEAAAFELAKAAAVL